MTDAELEGSPLYQEADFVWFLMESTNLPEGGAQRGPISYVTPGRDGPQLVLNYWHPEQCQVVVYGESVRIFSDPFLTCFAVTAAENGDVVLTGVDTRDGRNVVELISSDGVVLFREAIPESVSERLALPVNWGTGAAAGIPSSVYVYEDRIYVAVSRGTNTVQMRGAFLSNTLLGSAADGVAFLEITLGGQMSLLEVGDSEIVDGTKGWIVERDGELQAIVSTRVGDLPEDVALQFVSLDTGTRESIVPILGWDARYAQPEHGLLAVSIDASPFCADTIVEYVGSRVEIEWSAFYGTNGCAYSNVAEYVALNGDNGRRDNVSVQTPWAGANSYVGHRDLLAVNAFERPDGLSIRELHRDGSVVRRDLVSDGPGQNPGIASVSRFFKTIEGAYRNTSDAYHYMGWFERALHRAESGL